MNSAYRSNYYYDQIFHIRKMALYFALLCLVAFVYLDTQQFSGDLLNQVLTYRLWYQAIPLLAAIGVITWRAADLSETWAMNTLFSVAVVLIGAGHSEILAAAYENSRHFPKVGLVIVLYYAGILLMLPLIFSTINSVLIIFVAAHSYHAAGMPQDEITASLVFYVAFASCCLFMNYVSTKILVKNYKLVRQIDRQANTDPLTQLSNRKYFIERAADSIQQAHREGKSSAVILVDLDHFKQINDTLGHHQGDRVLQAVSEQLRRHCKRPMDMAARFGGDEFVMLLYDANEAYVHEVSQLIIQAIEDISDEMTQRNPLNQLGISVGVVINQPGENYSIKALLHMADHAMYEVKKNGKNAYRLADHQAFTQVGTDSQEFQPI